jgi:hypothetical protein
MTIETNLICISTEFMSESSHNHSSSVCPKVIKEQHMKLANTVLLNYEPKPLLRGRAKC